MLTRILATTSIGLVIALLGSGLAGAQTPEPCGPGEGSVPGTAANVYVTVESVQAEGFSGPAAFQAGGEPLQDITVVVDEETEWHGAVQSLEDVTVGAILQASGEWQDDCSVLAANVFSAAPTPTATEDASPAALPDTGAGGDSGDTAPTALLVAGSAVAVAGILTAASVAWRRSLGKG